MGWGGACGTWLPCPDPGRSPCDDAPTAAVLGLVSVPLAVLFGLVARLGRRSVLRLRVVGVRLRRQRQFRLVVRLWRLWRLRRLRRLSRRRRRLRGYVVR